MEQEYFQYIIESLNIDDLGVLSILSDEDCNTRIKSLPNSKLYQNSGLSEAKYRKVIWKLLALKFIEPDTRNKEHSYFISEYGQEAIINIIEKSKGSVEKWQSQLLV